MIKHANIWESQPEGNNNTLLNHTQRLINKKVNELIDKVISE